MKSTENRQPFGVRTVNSVIQLLRSGSKFVRASIVSLIVIAFIFLLLTKLDQASLMVADLVETSWFSFILTHFLIFGLALSLSHYPIYTYYAANLNNSQIYFRWIESRPSKLFRFVRIRYFERNDISTIPPGSAPYKKDIIANILRYLIGFSVFYVWMIVVWNSFEPNLRYDWSSNALFWIKIAMHASMILLLVMYVRFKILWSRFSKGSEKMYRIVRITAVLFLFSIALSIVLLIYMAALRTFSQLGWVMMQFLILSMTCNYFLFRLLRSDIAAINEKDGISIVKLLRTLINGLHESKNYLLLLVFYYMVSIAIIVISTVFVFVSVPPLNGIPIVLAFLYFYSFILMTSSKYFFIAGVPLFQEENPEVPVLLKTSRGYRARIFGIIGIFLIGIVPTFFSEQRTHELEKVKRDPSKEIQLSTFERHLQNKDTVFFIASHGGGLKANAWTLKVLNELQGKTEGRLLKNTVAISGASGGSLGLSLYIAMYKEDGDNTEIIDRKIDRVIENNYTSLDLTFLFGIDMFRSAYPLRLIPGKNRTYYSMLRYQECVHSNFDGKNDETPFREYWSDIFRNKEEGKPSYAPSLIMNTAGVDGRRGVLWSVRPPKGEFDSIFHHSVDLAELEGRKTLSYFDATSMTNRFPVFSPSAKIKNYGHFIDAGAIDNSGLLGCLDVLKYLTFNRKQNLSRMKEKHVVFIEIYNSKDLYIKHLLRDFEKEYGPVHWLEDESEQSTLSNDLSAGTNLDKFPGYLEGFMEWLESTFPQTFDYIAIPLPCKVSIAEVESVIKGTISTEDSSRLKRYLYKRNLEIQKVTEGPKGFTDDWEYYEPVLSRHCNQGAINYNKAILNHPDLQRKFKQIQCLTGIRRK